jgi:hypothetical protein
MSTMQDILDDARRPLNDADKTRYPDVNLLAYANAGLRTLRLKRPDLFFGQYATPFTSTLVTDVLPIDDIYRPALADYVTARAESIDDEHVNSAGAING